MNNGKDGGGGGAEDGGDPTGSGGAANKPVMKLNRRNIKAQVKRFKMETKAAKTLGKTTTQFAPLRLRYGSSHWNP